MSFTDADITETQALWYVWGQVDGGAKDLTLDDGYKFSKEYRELREAFDSGKIHFMPSMINALEGYRNRLALERSEGSEGDRIIKLADISLCIHCANRHENGELQDDFKEWVRYPLAAIQPGIKIEKKGSIKSGVVRVCDGCGRCALGDFFTYSAEVELIDDQTAAEIAAEWQGPAGDGVLFAEFASAIIAGRWVAPAGILPAIDRAIVKLPSLAEAYPEGYVSGDLGTVVENHEKLIRLKHHIAYLRGRESL
jgi:hypothetical protein